MRKLVAFLIGMSLLGAGCSGNGDGGSTESQGVSSQGSSETQVAEKCQSCGKELVDGKCAA